MLVDLRWWTLLREGFIRISETFEEMSSRLNIFIQHIAVLKLFCPTYLFLVKVRRTIANVYKGVLIHFSRYSISILPENVRKPLAF